MASPNVTSTCGVTCPQCVREPGGVAGRGVKTWRHLPTSRQGARWRRRTWRQNVASLAHAASGSQVASRDVASKRGVTCPRGVRNPLASPNVASKCGVTCPRDVREPGGVAGRGVKKWRHLPTWRQGARWRRRTWRQNVASLAYVASGSHVRSPELCQRSREWPHLASQNVASKCGVTCSRGVREPRGVAGRGVKTWRQAPSIYVASQDVASKHGVTKPGLPARVFKMCLQSSGDMCTPTGDHPVSFQAPPSCREVCTPLFDCTSAQALVEVSNSS